MFFRKFILSFALLFFISTLHTNSVIVIANPESGIEKLTDSQIKSYWSRLIFTGKGKPPRRLSDIDSLINHLHSYAE